MNLLVVTETGTAWPSGFVRAHIFEQHLRSIGWNARFVSRRPERLTRLIDHPSPSMQRIMRMGGGRIISTWNRWISQQRIRTIAALAERADCVFLQKVDSLALFDRLRAKQDRRIVFDLNDGLWLPHWRSFLGGELERVLGQSDAVTCDNSYGLAYAAQRSKQCFLVPDPPQIESFDAERSAISRSASPVRIGWIGSRNTATNLFAVYEPINDVLKQNPGAELRIVGTDSANPAMPRFETDRISYFPRYGHGDMVREALQMHIGIFPMFDVEESRARGVLKATVYMSAGAATMADPVGQIPELIDHGTTGFTPRSKQEWVDHLNILIADAALRDSVGNAAIEKMRSEYSLDACFASWKTALEGSA